VDYVLISFYNRGTALDPIWSVYGHRSLSFNDSLETFKTRSQAIEYCHSLNNIPVIQGQGGWIDKIVEQLSEADK
jgi:hypothetical protein